MVADVTSNKPINPKLVEMVGHRRKAEWHRRRAATLLKSFSRVVEYVGGWDAFISQVDSPETIIDQFGEHGELLQQKIEENERQGWTPTELEEGTELFNVYCQMRVEELNLD